VNAEMKLKQSSMTQEFVQMALLKSFELDRELPDDIQAIVDNYFTELQQQKMAEQQAMQQQAMQQGMMEQGEMPEGEMEEGEEYEEE
jgi:hypothetical protein